MERVTVPQIYSGYHYGPADLREIELGDGSMRLRLRDASGRALLAEYRGCVYWPITPDVVGRHFTIVEEISLDQLITPDHANVRFSLQTGGLLTSQLLQKWQLEGYRFYLHNTSEKGLDYLVVAKQMVLIT